MLARAASPWQAKPRHQAAFVTVLKLQLAAVRVRDAARDGDAQASATGVAVAPSYQADHSAGLSLRPLRLKWHERLRIHIGPMPGMQIKASPGQHAILRPA